MNLTYSTIPVVERKKGSGDDDQVSLPLPFSLFSHYMAC